MNTCNFPWKTILLNLAAGMLSRKSVSYTYGRILSALNVRRCFSKKKSDLDLTGVYPPITTPFDTQENIAYEKLQENFEKWKSWHFRGYVIEGSTGEFAFLSQEERLELVKFSRKHIPQGKYLIAGSGCESTHATVEMSQKMGDFGADAVLVVTPSYYKGSMTAQALYSHYVKVADSSPVPVILYSVPPNTNLDLPSDVVIRLSGHPNIIGIKDSGGDVTKLGLMVHKTQGQHFQVLAGSGGFFLPALSVGCVGGVFALANTLGKDLCHLQDLFAKGKFEESKKLQHRLIEPNAAVTKRYGIAGVKASMEWFGLYGGPTRLPLQPLSKEELEKLKIVFQENNFL